MEGFITAITTEHMIFVIILIFIVLFKKPLSRLIDRTVKIGKDGLTAGNTTDAQNENHTSATESVQALLDLVGNSIVIDELQQQIVNDLNSRGLDTSGGSNLVLLRHLAGTRLLLTFEQAYANIFGSQIKLLKRLNEAAGTGRPATYIDTYFQEVKEQYPDLPNDWDSSKYLEYLFSYMLIVESEGHYHITNLGVEYLTWIARRGKPEDKYY